MPLNRIKGDIWAFNYAHVVVPTNLEGVCGRGLAKQFVDKNPQAGASLRSDGRDGRLAEIYEMDGPLMSYADHTSIAFRSVAIFPVKRSWKDEASIEMIRRSCHKLVMLLAQEQEPFYCIMPVVGTGFGELNHLDVIPVLDECLHPMSHRILLISPDSEVFNRYPNSFKPGIRADRSAVEANR